MKPVTADDLMLRQPREVREVPTPCEGFAIVTARKLDPEKSEGGVFLATHQPAAQGFDEPTVWYERYTVVATSGCWYAGSTRVEHKAKVGDTVLMAPQAGFVAYDRDPRWPIGHRLISLQDVRVFYPCKTGEPMAKGDA